MAGIPGPEQNWYGKHVWFPSLSTWPVYIPYIFIEKSFNKLVYATSRGFTSRETHLLETFLLKKESWIWTLNKNRRFAKFK